MLLAGAPHGPAPEAPSSSFQREGQLGGALLMKEFVGTPGVLKGLRVPGGSSIPGSGQRAPGVVPGSQQARCFPCQSLAKSG